MKTDDLIGLLARDLDTPTARPWDALRRRLPLAAVLSAVVFIAILGIRHDIGDAAVLYPTALKLTFGALLAALAGLGALKLARPGSGLALPLFILSPVAALLAAALAADSAWLREPMAAWPSVLRCVAFIPLMALAPMAAFLAAMREGATTRPGAAGALAGLASAGLAITAYGLTCHEDSPLFIALWYSTGAVLAAVAGAAAARRVLAW